MKLDEEDADDLKTRCNFNVGDVFMVFEYVDYDLAGLLHNSDVVKSSIRFIILDLIC